MAVAHPLVDLLEGDLSQAGWSKSLLEEADTTICLSREAVASLTYIFSSFLPSTSTDWIYAVWQALGEAHSPHVLTNESELDVLSASQDR